VPSVLPAIGSDAGRGCIAFFVERAVGCDGPSKMEMSSAIREMTDFDYSALEPHLVDEVRSTAARIRALGDQQNEVIIGIGCELIGVKGKLGHGHFGAWLGAEFQMSVSTGERYIRVAEMFAGKIVTVTNLSPTSLYLLAAKSTPEPVREEIVGRLNSGEVVPNRDIKHQIQEAKAAAADAAVAVKQAAMTPQQRRYRARIQADQERQHQEWARQAAENQAAAGAAVQFLVDHLGERFPEFVELLNMANCWEFEKALRIRLGAGDIAPPATAPDEVDQ